MDRRSVPNVERPAPRYGRTVRIAGMEWVTALLALAMCLLFAAGIAMLTHSLVATVAATAGIGVGLVAVSRILRTGR
ncbi:MULTISPECIES: hypothetical protein [Nocardia]|uniref:Uncharacterized protein n=1 Tax=Nocardia flavorosea TaxID=53429 RepID=A0A846YHN5_9NOCA|nr:MULTISPECIES: hypothetical protein [Nocardia]NKY57132.1 hypothetical protein [Nocardia flavorosea]